ncbi:MAG: D-glycerate dehydrogenase, partial [Proteobacteria bacterium]|nr:D-glycerate dehydrogenase [Pseudomonadota bacterium]
MKILATGRLPEEVMSLLTKDHQVEANPQDRPMERSAIIRSLSDKEGLIATITDPIDGELMDLAPNLKMIANLAVGYDNIDLEAA